MASSSSEQWWAALFSRRGEQVLLQGGNFQIITSKKIFFLARLGAVSRDCSASKPTQNIFENARYARKKSAKTTQKAWKTI